MGIDPGTNRMGYGVLEVLGKNKLRAVVIGDIDMVKMKDPYDKLKYIFDRVLSLVDEYRPDEVALESPFFGENVQSMLKLGRAQGVAMAAALCRGHKVFEYAPRRVKQAITGNGGAAKEQVAAMLKGMLGVEYNPKRLDATDGLAVALCHYFESSAHVPHVSQSAKRGRSKSSSWENFVAGNPDRVVATGRGNILKKK
ncbi:MAG: crossover junction endodeoxyribonuclease RuvC [Tidjanibacter sp.]|nr:crossover junction endodeoxyribonuclease RuvC [Tidjanibacter sp.]